MYNKKYLLVIGIVILVLSSIVSANCFNIRYGGGGGGGYSYSCIQGDFSVNDAETMFDGAITDMGSDTYCVYRPPSGDTRCKSELPADYMCYEGEQDGKKT